MVSRAELSSFIISIDVGEETSAGGSLYEAASHLLHQLETLALPATWAISNPADSQVARRVQKAGNQEVAIAGDSSWVGRNVPRDVFATALQQRLADATAAGWKIEALALNGIQLRENLDVVSAAGVRVVRPAETSRFALPRRIGSRLWESQAHLRLPGDWLGNLVSLTQRTSNLRRAVHRKLDYHVQIDLTQLARSPRHGAVHRLLKEAFQLKSQQAIEVKTLSQSTADFAQSNSRSVLKAA